MRHKPCEMWAAWREGCSPSACPGSQFCAHTAGGREEPAPGPPGSVFQEGRSRPLKLKGDGRVTIEAAQEKIQEATVLPLLPTHTHSHYIDY